MYILIMCFVAVVVVIIFLLLIDAPCRSKRTRLEGHIMTTRHGIGPAECICKWITT